MDDEDPLRFACRCTPESTARVEAVWEWALDYLKNERHPEYNPTRADILTHVAVHLDRMAAGIDGFEVDQWFAVNASTWPYGAHKDDPFNTWIQCDTLEDGLVYTLKAFVEHFGETP